MTKTIFGPFLAFVLVALIVGVPAVSAAATKEQQQMMADIRMLQEQSQQLQILLGALNDVVEGDQRHGSTRGSTSRPTSRRKAFADQKLSVDNVTNDLRVVREKVDDNNVRVSSLTQGARRAWAGRATAGRAAPDPRPEPDAAGAGPALRRERDRARGSHRWPWARRTQQAVGHARRPTTRAGLQSDARQGCRGSTRTVRGFPKSGAWPTTLRCRSAIRTSMTASSTKPSRRCDTAIRNYPAGNAVAEAYYRKGLALQSLGQRDRAREAFDDVVKTYPDSDVGRLAKQRLGTP